MILVAALENGTVFLFAHVLELRRSYANSFKSEFALFQHVRVTDPEDLRHTLGKGCLACVYCSQMMMELNLLD